MILAGGVFWGELCQPHPPSVSLFPGGGVPRLLAFVRPPHVPEAALQRDPRRFCSPELARLLAPIFDPPPAENPPPPPPITPPPPPAPTRRRSRSPSPVSGSIEIKGGGLGEGGSLVRGGSLWFKGGGFGGVLGGVPLVLGGGFGGVLGGSVWFGGVLIVVRGLLGVLGVSLWLWGGLLGVFVGGSLWLWGGCWVVIMVGGFLIYEVFFGGGPQN